MTGTEFVAEVLSGKTEPQYHYHLLSASHQLVYLAQVPPARAGRFVDPVGIISRIKREELLAELANSCFELLYFLILLMFPINNNIHSL